MQSDLPTSFNDLVGYILGGNVQSTAAQQPYALPAWSGAGQGVQMGTNPYWRTMPQQGANIGTVGGGGDLLAALLQMGSQQQAAPTTFNWKPPAPVAQPVQQQAAPAANSTVKTMFGTADLNDPILGPALRMAQYAGGTGGFL